MKIKRFVAADMRTALRMVRTEHGPDAVILSNRRIEEGVEIVAASNYDEDAVHRALQDAQDAQRGSEPAPAAAAPGARADFSAAMAAALATPTARAVAVLPPEVVVTAPVREAAPAATLAGPAPARAPVAADIAAAAAPVLAAVPAPAAPANDAQLLAMREELAQMRTMIEREMHRLTDERLRGSPVRLQAMELMEDYGFDAGITRDIVLELPADTPDHRGRGMMLGLISRRLPVCPVDPLEAGGVIALVGPTGAGKTTTIAKLAARFASEHGARNVALVTTDTARIGGREQLYSYGRQLGIAVHEADSDAALIGLLQIGRAHV